MSALSAFTKRFVTVTYTNHYVIIDKLQKEENIIFIRQRGYNNVVERIQKNEADETCRIMNVKHDDYLLYLNEISLYVASHKQDSYRMFRIYKNNYTKRIKS